MEMEAASLRSEKFRLDKNSQVPCLTNDFHRLQNASETAPICQQNKHTFCRRSSISPLSGSQVMMRRSTVTALMLSPLRAMNCRSLSDGFGSWKKMNGETF
jgi:hypothetical protein